MLGRRHVLPSVLATLVELQVEGTFISGTYLVTVHHPISSDEGDLERALYGSFLPVPAPEAFPDPDPQDFMPEKMPGAVIPAKHARVELSVGKRRIRLKVMSKGDRPIQVCTLYSIYKRKRKTEKDWKRMVLITVLITRSDRITISSRPTRSCTLIACSRTVSDWIFLQEHRLDSSPVIRRRLRLSRSVEIASSVVEIGWRMGRWI